MASQFDIKSTCVSKVSTYTVYQQYGITFTEVVIGILAFLATP